MMYKGYEIEAHNEYTFSNGDSCTLYHVKKDGNYIKENLLSQIKAKSFITTLKENEK